MNFQKAFPISLLTTAMLTLTACEPAVGNNTDSAASVSNQAASVAQTAPVEVSPYVSLATSIGSRIPDQARVAINLRNEGNEIPQHLLVKIISDFSDAMLQESNGRFVMINRSSTEQIWEEVVEFNNVSMDALTQSASADVSVTVTPTIKPTGVDLSVTAYSLAPASLGQTIASSNTHIKMDLKSEVGLNINTIDDKLDNIADMIRKPQESEKNELARLIESFAMANGGPISILKTFERGCDRPERFEEGPLDKNRRNGYQYELSGTKIRCELYNEGEPILWENIDFEDKFDIYIYFGGPRAFPADGMLITSGFYPNSLDMPVLNIDGDVELIGCDNTLAPSFGYRQFLVTIDGLDPIYMESSWTAGSAGTWGVLQLAYSYEKLMGMSRGVNESGPPIKKGELGIMGDRHCSVWWEEEN